MNASSMCGLPLWLLAVTPPLALAQQLPSEQPPIATAVKVTEPPKVDGNVADDPVWKSVPPLTDFWQTAPDAGEPASERTEVRIIYTSEAIYFGVALLDRNPGGLTVAESRRDSPLDDTDSFRIILDTFHDGLRRAVRGWPVMRLTIFGYKKFSLRVV